MSGKLKKMAGKHSNKAAIYAAAAADMSYHGKLYKAKNGKRSASNGHAKAKKLSKGARRAKKNPFKAEKARVAKLDRRAGKGDEKALKQSDARRGAIGVKNEPSAISRQRKAIQFLGKTGAKAKKGPEDLEYKSNRNIGSRKELKEYRGQISKTQYMTSALKIDRVDRKDARLKKKLASTKKLSEKEVLSKKYKFGSPKKFFGRASEM